MDSALFTSDHHCFYFQGRPFIPIIQDKGTSETFSSGFNTVRITLPAFLQSDLNWEKSKEIARLAITQGLYIYWDIDFGLSSQSIQLEESSHFLSYTLALDQFTSSIWNEFKDHTFGLCLYRGPLDFSSRWIWNEQTEEHWEEWKKELGSIFDISQQPHFKHLFCTTAFAEYLHRLVSFLPDTLLVFCQIDVSLIQGPAVYAQLLSKARFEHLYLAIKGSELPLNGLTWQMGKSKGGWIGEGIPSFKVQEIFRIGFCLPKDEFCSFSVIETMEGIFKELQTKNISFRLIPEEMLSEQWDGLDALIVISKGLSGQGQRKLKGFCAAGGKVFTIGKLIGLSEESAFADLETIPS